MCVYIYSVFILYRCVYIYRYVCLYIYVCLYVCLSWKLISLGTVDLIDHFSGVVVGWLRVPDQPHSTTRAGSHGNRAILPPSLRRLLHCKSDCSRWTSNG